MVGGHEGRASRHRGGLLRHPRKVLVFLAGLFLIILGVALIVFPGPLTIPPIVLGVWLWSTEFGWADRWMQPVRAKWHDTKIKAAEKPVLTTVISAGGIVAAGVMVWVTVHYDLMARATSTLGL